VRIRIRFTKLGRIRFTSQRDVARLWERALRRAGLPLAYTEGFSPRPQLSFGLALPTGCESLAEYLDVVLDDAGAAHAGVSVDTLPDRLGALLPEGIEVRAVIEIDRRAGSLQQAVTSCAWQMWVEGVPGDQLDAGVARLMAAPSVIIERERKGRRVTDDLRPSLRDVVVADEADPTTPSIGSTSTRSLGTPGPSLSLLAELATQPRGVRPHELVEGLASVMPPVAAGGSALTLVRACRTQQWIERDGIREEPLAESGFVPEAGRAAHALERAS
jgi:radical SAM-linked protein